MGAYRTSGSPPCKAGAETNGAFTGQLNLKHMPALLGSLTFLALRSIGRSSLSNFLLALPRRITLLVVVDRLPRSAICYPPSVVPMAAAVSV